MIVWVLTTCHTQYTWDSSICIFLFNRKTLQVFVTYLIGALYVHPLWFCKHQHDNRVPSIETITADMLQTVWNELYYHKGCTYRAPIRYVTKTCRRVVLLNKKIHILLFQVYCVCQVVKTPTIISNNPVFISLLFSSLKNHISSKTGSDKFLPCTEPWQLIENFGFVWTKQWPKRRLKRLICKQWATDKVQEVKYS